MVEMTDEERPKLFALVPATTGVAPEFRMLGLGGGAAAEVKESARTWAKKLGEMLADMLELEVVTKVDGQPYARSVVKLDGDWVNELPSKRDWQLEVHEQSVATAVQRRDTLVKSIADVLSILSKIPI